MSKPKPLKHLAILLIAMVLIAGVVVAGAGILVSNLIKEQNTISSTPVTITLENGYNWTSGELVKGLEYGIGVNLSSTVDIPLAQLAVKISKADISTADVTVSGITFFDRGNYLEGWTAPFSVTTGIDQTHEMTITYHTAGAYDIEIQVEALP